MGARIVFIGDDFTGASDSLAAYARRGLRTRLVIGDAAQHEALDVLGIATDLRSLPPDRALDTLRAIWPLVEAEAPEIIHLKVCSTFDSAPHIGSIGAVAAEIMQWFHPETLAVIGGQPSLGRYCAFGTLFARGPDGAVHRIDRHPIMARHPVTPMGEADLGRHLAAQGLDLPVRIAVPELDDTAQTARQLAAGPALVDATCAQDQAQISLALRQRTGRTLLIGASSVAEILAGPPSGQPPLPLTPRKGGVLVFAGSRSSTTAAQVAKASRFERVALTPALLHAADAAGQIASAFPAEQDLLVHLLPEAEYSCDPDQLADACATLVQALTSIRPPRALGLAGGDTSSRIAARLGFDALDFHRDLGAGTCVCLGQHADPARNGLPVMLKGGQMGAATLFDDFALLY